jgi:hypothetical protein
VGGIFAQEKMDAGSTGVALSNIAKTGVTVNPLEVQVPVRQCCCGDGSRTTIGNDFDFLSFAECWQGR